MNNKHAQVPAAAERERLRVLGAARQGGGRHDQRAGIPSARFSECCTLRGTHTPTTGVPGGSTSCCRVGGAGGFPPRHCVLRSTSLDQHHCRDNCGIYYPQLSEVLSTPLRHSTHQLTTQSLRLVPPTGSTAHLPSWDPAST